MVLSEYRAHLKREQQPYSAGHQVMYEVPIAMMRGTKQEILDVGFGIGWGLDRMVRAGVVDKYVGYERDYESYNFVRKRYKGQEKIKLRRETFFGCSEKFQHVLCIETIEHVQSPLHADFVGALREACRDDGTLWLSTPDRTKSVHGVLKKADALALLRGQFSEVASLEDQWTTMYVCRP